MAVSPNRREALNQNGNECAQVEHKFQIHGNHLASLQQFAQPVEAFTGIEFSGGDAIAKEDPSETLGEHNLAAGRPHGDRGMLARTATAKIVTSDYDRVFTIELAGFDV